MLDKRRLRTFVLGGAVGALVGILLAPRSGRELRGSIANRAGEARERGRETYFEAQEQMRDRLAEAREGLTRASRGRRPRRLFLLRGDPEGRAATLPQGRLEGRRPRGRRGDHRRREVRGAAPEGRGRPGSGCGDAKDEPGKETMKPTSFVPMVGEVSPEDAGGVPGLGAVISHWTGR